MAAELMNPANVETAIADCRKQMQVAVDADLAAYQLAGIREDLKYCEVRHAEGKSRADQLRSVCAGLQSQHDQLDTAAAGAAVAGWSAYQSALQAVATVQRRVESATVGMTAAELVLANHEIARSSINPLLEPDTYPAVLSQLSLYQSQIHMLQLTAGLVLGEDCLTCGAPARDVAERVTVAIKDLCDVQESHSIVSKQLEASQQWFADYNRYRHALEVARAEYEVATTALANIPSVQPVTSCEEAKTVLATAKRLTEELNTAKIELISLDVYIADLAGRISQLLLQVAAQEKVCAALVRMNADEVQAVNTELSTWLEVQVAIRACELQRATLRERVDSTRRRIVNVQQAERQVATVTHLRELLTSVRGIFHKESAPALVIQSNLHRLQAEINRQLSLFDADYRVQVADGASFTALFEGGIVQPVQRLSYGQKVALAFSFRLALNRTVIPQVNGLYLDEPTAYLDVRRIDAFAPVFEQLRQASQSTGLQCVIVTHERRLSHLFDNVVEVL
jgi:ABC-type arginine transport system ATPase subunit